MSWNTTATEIPVSKEVTSALVADEVISTSEGGSHRVRVTATTVKTVSEKRGLTAAAAQALCGVTHADVGGVPTPHNFRDTQTYGGVLYWVEIPNLIDDCTVTTATRANEAGGWTVTITRTVTTATAAWTTA